MYLFLYETTPQAGAVTGTLYELFQVVFKLRQEAGLSKNVQNSSQAQNPPQVSNGKYHFFKQINVIYLLPQLSHQWLLFHFYLISS